MWINATYAETVGLAVSTIHGNAVVSHPDKSVPILTARKHDKHSMAAHLFDKPRSGFGLQTGFDWNPKLSASDVLWIKYVERGHHFEFLMSASEKGSQSLIVGDTPVKSPWVVSCKETQYLYG